MDVLVRLGSLLALIAVGVGARQLGILTERRTDRLTAVAFYVALPALVFSSTYDRALRDLVSPALVGGAVFVLLSTVALAWVVHRRRASPARRSVAVVQSYHSNLGFLGLPLVSATLGDAAAGTASVVLGVGILVQTPVTVGSLIAINDADASYAAELRGIATNPVLLSLVAGLAASQVGLALPEAVDTGLVSLSELALPIAVLCVGASLRIAGEGFDPGLTGSVIAMKLALMPAVAWLVFSALAVGETAFAAVVVMFAMPTAVSTYVYAGELGGDTRLASLNVFASTVASLATVLVLLQFLG